MAMAMAIPSPLSSQSLSTTRKSKSIFKLTIFPPFFLPSSTPPQLVLNHHRRQRRHRGFAAVACLPSAPKSSIPLSTKLYVSGLSFRTTEESLRNAFQNFGELLEVNLVMDRIANRPRGFAFLRYATVEESQRAIEGMHGKNGYIPIVVLVYSAPIPFIKAPCASPLCALHLLFKHELWHSLCFTILSVLGWPCYFCGSCKAKVRTAPRFQANPETVLRNIFRWEVKGLKIPARVHGSPQMTGLVTS